MEHRLWGVGLWAQAVVREHQREVNWEAPSVATAGSQSRRETQLSAWGPRGAAAAVRWRGADFRHCPGTSRFCSMLTTPGNADPWHIPKFCAHLFLSTASAKGHIMTLFCMSLN